MAGHKTEIKYLVTKKDSLKIVHSSKYASKKIKAFHRSDSHRVFSLPKIMNTPLMEEINKANAIVETKVVKRIEPKPKATATVIKGDLTDGQIITLANGDIVKVSLEVIARKVTKLEVNKKYKLQYNEEFCHARNTNGENFSGRLEGMVFTYVGKIHIGLGERHIFYAVKGGVYSMWGTNNLNFVVGEVS